LKVHEAPTPRPTHSCSLIIDLTAREMYDTLDVYAVREVMEKSQKEHRIHQIYMALTFASAFEFDGYRLMHYLNETYDWKGCFRTTQGLQSAYDTIRRNTHAQIIKWVADNGIEPDLPIGTHVRFNGTDHEILGYNPLMAHYRISPETLREFVNRATAAFSVQYEDVKPL